MKRKVILQGGKTLMVSLPIKWAERFNVKKGDELELEADGGRICFSANSEPEVSSVEVSLEGLNERAVRYVLSGLHKTGYDEIVVLYDRPQNLKIIEELVSSLYVGFAIVEQDSKKCVLRAISRELASEFDSALRRSFLVTLSMGESLLEALREGDMAGLASVITLEKTNNQLTNFCERLLNKNPGLAGKKQNFLYIILWNLEKVCDNYKYICRDFQGSRERVDKRLLSVLESVQNLLRGYYELFYKFDIKRVSGLSDAKGEIEEAVFRLIPKVGPNEQRMGFYLLDSACKLVEFSASMTALRFGE